MDLDQLRKLAGITPSKGYTPYQGSNISVTGMEKRRLEKENNIKPGSPEWFKLWFSKPYLTGEKPIGDESAPKVKKNKR